MTPHYQIYRANVQYVPLKKFIGDNDIINYAKIAIELETKFKFKDYNVASRKRELVFCRYMFFVLVKRNTSLSLKKVGELFLVYNKNRSNGKYELKPYDHTDVIHGRDVIIDIESLANRDSRFATWQNVLARFNELKNMGNSQIKEFVL